MQITRRFIPVLAIAAVLPLLGDSKADPINKDKGGVAIKGYDPVAYFTQSKPVPGSSAFTHQWMNSTWWFASAADRDEFARNPEKYAPQFGGYCAYGVSQNHTAPIDPEADDILNLRGVKILPDILANAGGVTVSYFEWVQNLQYYRWGLNRVRQELDAVLTRAFDAVWLEHNESKCNLRTAAYMIAIRKVQAATELAGHQ